MIDKRLLKQAITEVIDGEMDRVRQEIQARKKEEIESTVSSIIKLEM